MGDIWPYAPPNRFTWDQLHYFISTLTGVTPDPNIFAAIGIAESGGDASVINDTPATGDYSVGLWQINYFDGLYAGRAQAYGTPQQLVLGGLAIQARAAVSIWRGQGYGAWSTYTSGAYRQYLGPGQPTGPAQTPGQQTAPLPGSIQDDSWGDVAHLSGDYMADIAQRNYDYATAIRNI